MTIFAPMSTISKSWQGILNANRHTFLARFRLSRLDPRPITWLGSNDFNFCAEENAWVVGCATYLKECVRRIEADAELLQDGEDLWKQRTPLAEGCHPELDDSDLLPEAGIRKYQMLIGMAQWACTIGRLDIAFAVSSLSRFRRLLVFILWSWRYNCLASSRSIQIAALLVIHVP